MRWVVIGVVAVALAGCGAGDARRTAAARPEAPEVVYLYRVLGDDPMPDSVSVRADGTADVRRGGGQSGIRIVEVALSRAETERAERLAARTPWKALEGRTVTPGGFGGWDNDMRYLLRRGQRSITVTAVDMPRSIRPLVRMLDAIIEGDTGRQLSSELHAPRSSAVMPRP